jgi:hypothetical protein
VIQRLFKVTFIAMTFLGKRNQRKGSGETARGGTGTGETTIEREPGFARETATVTETVSVTETATGDAAEKEIVIVEKTAPGTGTETGIASAERGAGAETKERRRRRLNTKSTGRAKGTPMWRTKTLSSRLLLGPCVTFMRTGGSILCKYDGQYLSGPAIAID